MADWRPIIDIAKILGKTVIDVMNTGDYRITIIIERKIDDRQGIVIEQISVDKRMNALDAEIITKRLKELVEKK